jgi:hypothetical protein
VSRTATPQSSESSRAFHSRSGRRLSARVGVLLGALGLVAGMLQVAFIAGAPPAGATGPTPLYANQLTDDEGGAGSACLSPSSDNGCSLRSAADYANANPGTQFQINLIAGTYNLEAADGGDIEMDNGSGVIVTGQGQGNTIVQHDPSETTSYFRIFRMDDASVQMTGLTISGGNPEAYGGGGILGDSSSELFLTDVTVACNGLETATEACPDAPGGGSVELGGGIYMGTGENYLLGSGLVVLNNQATDGGGIAVGGDSEGLILGDDSTGNHSVVSDNTAVCSGLCGAYGGGIYDIDGPATLTNAVVSGNSVSAFEGSGAGIYYEGASDGLTLSGGSVTCNGLTGVSPDTGPCTGAPTGDYVFLEGGGIDDEVGGSTLTGVDVDGNAAEDGGGIYEDGDGIDMTGGTLSNNTATDDGGGIDIEYGVTNLVESVSIGGNSAEDGGGSYIDDSESLAQAFFVADANDGNSASYSGGGIEIDGGGLVVSDTNTLGELPVVIGPSTVSSNTAEYGGGLVFENYDGGGICDGSATYYSGDFPSDGSSVPSNDCVTDTTLQGNTAFDDGGGEGGAITNWDGKLTVSDSDLTGNSTDGEGGAIYDDEYTTVRNSSITANTVVTPTDDEGYGGGIYNDEEWLYVANSNISGNSVSAPGTGGDAYGGGVYGDDGDNVLVNSTISGNSLSSIGEADGAGFYDSSDDSSLQNDTIAANAGATYGGGIWTSDSDEDDANLTISGNQVSAPGGGGGMYADSSSEVNISGSILSGDTAAGVPNECDLGVAFSTEEYNIDQGTTCGLSGTGDLSSTDPDLAPLGSYAGPSDSSDQAGVPGSSNELQVMAPATGSPVVGAETSCLSADDSTPLTTDEVGNARGDTCDMGAYEGTSAPASSLPTPPAAPAGSTSSASGSSGSPTGTATATNSGTTASGTGEGALTVAQYSSDPVGAPTFSSAGEYFDVDLSAGNTFSSATIEDCNLNGGTTLEWWNPAADSGAGAWQAVTPTLSVGSPPCLIATISSTSSPSLAELTGTVLAVGSGPALVTLAQGPPTAASVADGSVYSGQLTVTNGVGTVTYAETASAQSADVVVSSSGALSAGSSLAPGTYTVSGTDADTAGDTGTWSFALTVNASTTTTVPPTPTQGYREVASDGGVFNFGNAGSFGSEGGKALSSPVVGMAATADGAGYWEVSANGTVYAFGDAVSYGSLAGTHLNSPIVGIAATATGKGYWLVASDGGIFSYGDAKFFGSTGSLHLNKPIVGMAATPDGGGYWLVASDGGIFSYGDAAFYGSMGGKALNKPIVGLATTPSGKGYWLVASDGGIFSYGDAKFLGSTGSIHLNKPVVGMLATPDGGGYWLVASDGGIFAYGDATFEGSEGGTHLNSPVVGMAAG